MRNYFTFAGVDSRDFGVYINGQGTFSAPEKAYNFYPIPGRNGDLIGSDHRLENISVTYSAFIYKDFKQNVENFRTFLLSLDGYQTLTDSYHTDEYRMACYVGPFDPKVSSKNDAGTFNITFNCKPQRFLNDGDTVLTWVNGGSQSLTGTTVKAYGGRLDRSVLNVTLPLNIASGTRQNPRTWTPYTDLRMVLDGAEIYNEPLTYTEHPVLNATVNMITGEGQAKLVMVDAPNTVNDWTKSGSTFTCNRVLEITNLVLCTHYTVSNSGAAGTIWFENGVLTVHDSGFSTAAAFALSMTDVKLAGKPLFLSLDETQEFPTFTMPTYDEPLPDGWFTLGFSGPGAVVYSLAYTPLPHLLNPTYMTSKPLIRVYGDGTIKVNDITITVSGGGEYTDIDCEMMDCYEGSTNRNNAVTFSTYDFPVLKPGENPVEFVSGITVIEITPRWWRV